MYDFLCTCLHFGIYLHKCAQISVPTEINAREGKKKKISVLTYAENLVQMFPEQLCRAASENPTFFQGKTETSASKCPTWLSKLSSIELILARWLVMLESFVTIWYIITCNFIQIRKPEINK